MSSNSKSWLCSKHQLSVTIVIIILIVLITIDNRSSNSSLDQNHRYRRSSPTPSPSLSTIEESNRDESNRQSRRRSNYPRITTTRTTTTPIPMIIVNGKKRYQSWKPKRRPSLSTTTVRPRHRKPTGGGGAVDGNDKLAAPFKENFLFNRRIIILLMPNVNGAAARPGNPGYYQPTTYGGLGGVSGAPQINGGGGANQIFRTSGGGARRNFRKPTRRFRTTDSID